MSVLENDLHKNVGQRAANPHVTQEPGTDLFEGELDSLVFPVFQHIHQVLYGIQTLVQLPLPFYQLLLLLRETHKLIQSFLVHVGVLQRYRQNINSFSSQ